MTPNARKRHDVRRPILFGSDLFPGGLLPADALTTIQLGDLEYEGAWEAGVGDLVLATLALGEPVLYVRCGGLGGYYDGEDELQQAGAPKFALFDDRDRYVHGPKLFPPRQRGGLTRGWTEDGRPVYPCHSPSVDAIQAALDAYERAHGPTMLVLGDAQLLRPFWALATARVGLGVDAPGGLKLETAQIDRWRTSDVLRLVHGRAAATVVVWDQTEFPSSGLAALVDESRVHVTALDTSPHPTLQVRQRRSPALCWDAPACIRATPAGMSSDRSASSQGSGRAQARRPDS